MPLDKYTVVKLAGAAYLLWLAWQVVRPGGRNAFVPEELPVVRPRKLFTMGLLTNLLNPKIAILYISLLPQFVDPAAGSIALQGLLLGLTQISVALLVNGLIVLSAGKISAFLGRRPAWLRLQRYLMGTVLAGLAVKLAFRQVPAHRSGRIRRPCECVQDLLGGLGPETGLPSMAACWSPDLLSSSRGRAMSSFDACAA